MEKMNESQMCELVQDLLPLYVDGECSEVSKNIVEEHIKTCEECGKLLQMMESPLEVETPVSENVSVVRALKKVRDNVWKRVLIIVLIICLIVVGIPCGISTWHSFRDYGIAFENLDELKREKYILDLWKNEGAEAVTEQLNAEIVYEDLIEEHFPIIYEAYLTDEEIPHYREKYGGYNIFGYEADEYVELEIGGETYMVTKSFYYEETKESGVSEYYDTYLKTGDADEYWYQIVTESDNRYMIPEELYTQLMDKYGDLSAKNVYYTSYNKTGEDERVFQWPYGQKLVSIEMNEETYYYRYDEGNLNLCEFPTDMQEITGCDQQMDELYLLIGQSDIITPELYEYYQERQKELKGWYLDYQYYYEKMGVAEFTENWQKDVNDSFIKLEKEWGALTDFEFTGHISRCRSSAGTSANQYGEGWRSMWKLTFENGEEEEVSFYTPEMGKPLITRVTGSGVAEELTLRLNVVEYWPY